jgi:ELWxxDGT repeat protein
MMADAVTGAGGANPDWIVDCPTTGAADRVCYAGSGGKAGTGGRELWASAGPGNDTALLADLNPKGGSDPAELFRNGDRLLLSAIYGATGRELVVLDLPSSRVTAIEIRAGVEGSNPHGFFAWDDRHTFFAANDGESGSELWVTDGTAAGTQQVADLNRGAGSSHPWVLARSGDRLFVQAWTASSGNELAVIDLGPQ